MKHQQEDRPHTSHHPKDTIYGSYQPVRLAHNSFEPSGGVDPGLNPIIYLHGVTAFKEHWGDIPQVVANATKRRAYAIDGRNHGDSEWTDYYNFDMNVDDLIHFMDSLDIKKAILVGHSMGGITAIKTALKWPDRIERIVVEDMIVRQIPQQLVDNVRQYVSVALTAIEAAPDDLDEDGVKKFILHYISTRLPPDLLVLQEFRRQNRDPENFLRFLKIRRDANGRFSFKANLKVIQRTMENRQLLASEAQGISEAPACFIYGKLSAFLVGADEHHIKEFFPKAVLVGIEDAGHDVHNEKPLEFTDALLEFIT